MVCVCSIVLNPVQLRAGQNPAGADKCQSDCSPDRVEMQRPADLGLCRPHVALAHEVAQMLLGEHDGEWRRDVVHWLDPYPNASTVLDPSYSRASPRSIRFLRPKWIDNSTRYDDKTHRKPLDGGFPMRLDYGNRWRGPTDTVVCVEDRPVRRLR